MFVDLARALGLKGIVPITAPDAIWFSSRVVVQEHHKNQQSLHLLRARAHVVGGSHGRLIAFAYFSPLLVEFFIVCSRFARLTAVNGNLMNRL